MKIATSINPILLMCSMAFVVAESSKSPISMGKTRLSKLPITRKTIPRAKVYFMGFTNLKSRMSRFKPSSVSFFFGVSRWSPAT